MAMPEKPEKFSLPSVEVLALLAQVAQQGSSFFLPSFYGRAKCLRLVWEVLGLPGGGDDGLCMCHVDLSNCFWSMRLPEAFWGAFHVSDGTGGVLSFRCLPFGWKYGPFPCQKVLERLMEEVGLVGVLVLIYIDDVLIVGWGKARVREQARCALKALCDAGGVISPKSTLEPVTRVVWLGKDVDLRGGGAACGRRGIPGKRCLRTGCDCPLETVVCGACSSFWGARSGFAGLALAIAPTCRAHVLWGPPPVAVYPCQVAMLYVYGVCAGVAGLVHCVPSAGVG